MKTGLLFALTYGVLSIFFLLASRVITGDFSAEATTYLFIFYVFCLLIDLPIFAIAVWIIRRLSIGAFWKTLIYLGLALMILNIPYGILANKWITVETIRDLSHFDREFAADFFAVLWLYEVLPLLTCGLSMFLFRRRLFRHHP